MSNNYSYYRSTYTGQVYKYPSDLPIPVGNGWEAVHESTYIDWCLSNGFNPW